MVKDFLYFATGINILESSFMVRSVASAFIARGIEKLWRDIGKMVRFWA